MDGLRKEQFLGTDKYILGDSGTDLVLETLGKVYVKIGNQTKVLSDVLELLDATADTTTTNDITLVNGTIELEGLTYPGDGKFIFDTLSSTLYISYNKGYIAIAQGTSGSGEYVKKSGDTMTGQLEITTNKAPLIVASRELVDNLNVQYLDGYSSDELAKKAVDEIIKGKWTFSSNTIFKNNVRHYGDIVTSGNIGTSEFMSGFSGYGWRLDTTTNMLTVDYLVVRKAMRVYELSVTKITATNGAIWVTNSSKCKEAKQPIILTQNMVENAKEGIYTTNQALGKLLNSKEYYIVDVDENKEIITKTVEISNSSTINTVSTQFVCFKYMAYIIDPKKLTESTYFAGLSTLYNHSLLNTQAYSDTSSKTYANDVKELNSCMMIFPLYQEVDTFNDTLGTHTYSNTFNRDTNFFTVYDEDNFSLITNKTSDYIVGLQPYYKYFALDKTIYDAALAKTATSNVVPVPGLFVVVTSDDEYPVFKGADILRCQKFEDTSNIKYYDAIVLSHIQTRTFIVQKAPSVFDKYTKISYNKDGSVASYEESYNEDQYNKTLKSYNSNTGKEEYNSSDTHTGDTTNQDSKLADIAAEDSLVQIGNIENLERQGSLYLTSSDDQSPYMDVIANLNRPDYSVLYKQPIFDTKEFVIDSLDNIKATDTSKFYKLKNKYYYQSIVPEIPYGIIYNYGKESNSIYATVNLTKIDTTRNTATVTNTRSSGDLSLTRVSINNTEAGVTPTSATRDITVSLIYSIPEGHIAQYRAGETTDITTLGWNNMEDNIHLTVSTNTGIKNLAFQIRDMSVIASVNCYVTLTPTKDSVVSIKNNKHVCDYIKPVKVRVGKLDGIYDNKLGNKQPYGYGLYGENVFLTGEFYLNNGNSVIDVAQDGIKAYYKNAGITISDYLDNSGNKVPTTINSDGMQEYQQCIEFDADRFIFKLPTGKKMTFSSMFGSDNKFDHALLDVQGIIQSDGLIINDSNGKPSIVLVGSIPFTDANNIFGKGVLTYQQGTMLAKDAVISGTAYLTNGEVGENFVVKGKLDGVTGNFKELTCLGRLVYGEDEKFILNSTQLSIYSMDIIQNGTKNNRSLRFLTSNVWCRGVLGAQQIATLEIRGRVGYYYTQGSYNVNAKEIVYGSEYGSSITFESGLTTNNDVYYKVPLYGTDTTGDASGFPVNLILLNNSSTTYTYNYLFVNSGFKKITVINVDDSFNENYVYINGGTQQFVGGAVIDMIYVGNHQSPAYTGLGKGWFVGASRDNDWRT